MNWVIVLNKPKGLTSQEAVTKIKRIFKVKKAGHAGALDPMATGVLLVCLNEATKITPFLIELDKEYVFKARFGVSTDSYDAEGKITKVVENFEIERVKVEQTVKKYIGEIMQLPPMYSAVKIDGTPLYKLARKGVEVERKPKKVTVYSIEIEEFVPPFVTFKVSCSKGTYIRTLCHDIGEDLGVGAHIVELVRTKVGKFTVEEAVKLESLKDDFNSSKGSILTIDNALYFLPSVVVPEQLKQRFLNGNPVKIPFGVVPSGVVKVKDNTGRLLGVGYGNGMIVKPERIIWEDKL